MLQLAQSDAGTGVTQACGDEDRSFICKQVYEWTGNDNLATAAEWLLDRPIRVVLILLLAWIVTRVIKKAIVRFTKKILTAPSDFRLHRFRDGAPGVALMDEKERARAEARAETLGHVLRSVAVAVVWGFAALVMLGEVGVNLGPLIAGAGIGGVALGFGAQSIVKDFLSGLFMLIEDHYGVGDVIDLNFATGTVEQVSLRSTTIRDLKGTVWHIPNGQITRIGNYSQLWSRAVIDIEVPYDADLRSAMDAIQRTSEEFWKDPEWQGGKLSERPDIWGVQQLSKSGIVLRVAAKTEPSMQWGVERELRLRLKEALEAEGIQAQAA